MKNRHNSLLISVIGLALTGCGAQEIEEHPDVADSATDEVLDTAPDTSSVECCPINLNEYQCSTYREMGGTYYPERPGGCNTTHGDGGHPMDYLLLTDEWGCPYWAEAPNSRRCADPDGGQLDTVDVDDASDAGDLFDSEDLVELNGEPDAELDTSEVEVVDADAAAVDSDAATDPDSNLEVDAPSDGSGEEG